MPLLFSYGTLQQPAVQRATFGRLLVGSADELVGFEILPFEVTDPRFTGGCDRATYTIVRATGRSGDRVPGTTLELTDDELASADAYEPAGYTRIVTTLASGREAWVYAAV